MGRLTISLLSLSAISALCATYLFTFGVPLESACHMHDAAACVRLAETMGRARVLALVAVALLLGAIIKRVLSRTRDWRRRG